MTPRTSRRGEDPVQNDLDAMRRRNRCAIGYFGYGLLAHASRRRSSAHGEAEQACVGARAIVLALHRARHTHASVSALREVGRGGLGVLLEGFDEVSVL